MSRYRRLNINSSSTPDISVTWFWKMLKFEVFNEKTGSNLGYRTRDELEKIGFTRKQLLYVQEHGTTNFLKLRSR